jgi:hypothetical protein
MQCKATNAEGPPRSTLTVCPALFTAFGAPQPDVISLHPFEFAGVRIPCPLGGVPLQMGVFDVPPWPTLYGRLLRLGGCVKGVLHHVPGQLPTKFKLGLVIFVPCPSPRLHRIHLGNRTQERELPHRPPLCPPNLLQSNGIMTMIVHIVYPMLCL